MAKWAAYLDLVIVGTVDQVGIRAGQVVPFAGRDRRELNEHTVRRAAVQRIALPEGALFGYVAVKGAVSSDWPPAARHRDRGRRSPRSRSRRRARLSRGRRKAPNAHSGHRSAPSSPRRRGSVRARRYSARRKVSSAASAISGDACAGQEGRGCACPQRTRSWLGCAILHGAILDDNNQRTKELRTIDMAAQSIDTDAEQAVIIAMTNLPVSGRPQNATTILADAMRRLMQMHGVISQGEARRQVDAAVKRLEAEGNIETSADPRGPWRRLRY
jgi:hypothetical protein